MVLKSRPQSVAVPGDVDEALHCSLQATVGLSFMTTLTATCRLLQLRRCADTATVIAALPLDRLKYDLLLPTVELI